LILTLGSRQLAVLLRGLLGLRPALLLSFLWL
jgi:hypothetical protein